LPYLTAKSDEAHIVRWYLRRAVVDKAHRITPTEATVLETMSKIKRCGGEAPAELRELLREVIPSQADRGHRREAEGAGSEGVETRAVSSTDNPPHEPPGSQEVH
jgi:hypothetical protein